MSDQELVQKEKQLEDYVKEVDYELMDTTYVPSREAIEVVNFIKMVNGAKGEENKTPVMHLIMLDDLIHHNDNLLVVHRGGAKALSVDTQIPTPTGNVSIGELQVGDTVFTRNGVETVVTHKSEVFNKPMYLITLVDGRKLKVSEDHLNILLKRKTGKGVPAGTFVESVLTTKEVLTKGIHYNRKVSYHTSSGKETKWYIPTGSGVSFTEKDIPIDAYTIGAILGDGSIDKKCGFTKFHTHTDDVEFFLSQLEGANRDSIRYDQRNLNTLRFSLKGIGSKVKSFIGTENVYGKRIPQTLLWSSTEHRIAVLQGLMDTDGTVGSSGYGSFCTVSEGLANDVAWLVRSLGGEVAFGNEKGDYFRLSIKTNFCPFRLPRKIAKWKPCLHGKVGIASIVPIALEPSQCIAVADKTHSFLANDFTITHNTSVIHEYVFLYIAVYGKFFKWGKQEVAIYVSDTMENGVRNMREQLEHRWNDSEFLKKYIPYTKFTEDRWEFHNINGSKFFIKGFAAMTGVRGFKKYGKRPTWCGFDDLLSDKNAKSPTIIADIENVIYKAATEALHPSKRKIAWTGTPFSKKDPLYKAAGSGAWKVRAFPLCEQFPCKRENFRGSWSDRFTYESTLENYNKKLKNGQISAFNQELMLRIASEEDRLVQDHNINWYNRSQVVNRKYMYNFYITTDFATSSRQSADMSVISVWAYSSTGVWLLVDGICRRQDMGKNIDDLFRLAAMYKPQSVGVEVSGQQGGFIPWIQRELIDRNQWFSLASDGNNNSPGIRPKGGDKLQRFNTMVPVFKQGKILLPVEWRGKHELVIEMEDELTSVTYEGFKSRYDDACDTISMLAVMNPWKPSNEVNLVKDDSGLWGIGEYEEESSSGLSNYIV